MAEADSRAQVEKLLAETQAENSRNTSAVKDDALRQELALTTDAKQKTLMIVGVVVAVVVIVACVILYKKYKSKKAK